MGLGFSLCGRAGNPGAGQQLGIDLSDKLRLVRRIPNQSEAFMRKISVQTFITLDGVTQGPVGPTKTATAGSIRAAGR